MNKLSKNTYRFGDFLFDADKLALYHRNQLIRNVGEKSLQVLAVLLQNANELASHDEIIGAVWRDNSSGVTSVHIAQNIKKLRKVLAEYEPDKKFIESVKGRGYMFVGDNAPEEIETPQELSFLQSEQPFIYSESENAAKEENHWHRTFLKPAYIFTALFSVFFILLLAWFWFPQNDEQKIKRVVEESQKFESLVLYNNPQSFEEAQLAGYWLPQTDFNSDLDIKKIRAGVQRLVNEGKYYGKESKCEQFEFQSIEINQTNDFAIVKTLEKWFIAEYLKDGTLLKNKTVGPYFVIYTVRKIDGQWLVEKSNTARAKPAPPPQ
ncbi:MAG: winged helix-turn-helix domain-containing protein [Pyrinomonadaceae bacterium]